MRNYTTLITAIAKAVQNGDDDTAVNAIIQSYLDERSMAETVSEWRVANYADLRRWAYPHEEDFLDAQVKIAAGGSLALEGQAQLDDYYAGCLSVKLRFPKI